MGLGDRVAPACAAGARVVVLALWWVAGQAWAQANAPAGPAEPVADAAVSDRTKRAAEKVFQWIKLHGEQPRKPARADARAEATPRPADKPRDEVPTVKRTASPRDDSPKSAAVQESAPTRSPRAAAAAPPADPPATLTVTPVPAEPAERSAAATAPAVAAPAQTVELPPAQRVLPPAQEPPTVPMEAALPQAPDELVLVRRVDPTFGATLMRQLRRGTAEVRFEVLPDGTVGSVEVINSTSPRLHTAAVEAVRQWRFQPMRQARTAAVELGFNLD